MTSMKDYYRVLGVSSDASQADIKRAFRRLARESHPDAIPDDPVAEARFREAAEAYEVLSDPGRRAAYDRGDRLAVGDLFSTFAGFDELFEVFFGGGRFTRPRGGPRAGRDVGMAVEIDLAGAVFGTTRDVQFPVAVGCEVCQGSGAAPGTQAQTCGRCGGSGALRMASRGLMGSLLSVTTCDRCGGLGEVIARPCSECRGRGVTEGTRSLTVEIPAGVEDGARLRLGGRGESGERGAPAGDLYIQIRIQPHELFTRQGDDLRCLLPVGIAQAALGARMAVPLLEGGQASVEVRRGVQHGSVLRVPGKGATRLGRRGRGDLVVEVEVVVPSDLSPEEESALRSYAERRGEATGGGRS